MIQVHPRNPASAFAPGRTIGHEVILSYPPKSGGALLTRCPRNRVKSRTERAVEDLVAIKEFVSQGSPAYALAVIGRLYQSVGQLAQFPDSGRAVPEYGRPEIRELVRPPYRIVYRRRPELVEVLLVFRSSMPLPSILE